MVLVMAISTMLRPILGQVPGADAHRNAEPISHHRRGEPDSAVRAYRPKSVHVLQGRHLRVCDGDTEHQPRVLSSAPPRRRSHCRAGRCFTRAVTQTFATIAERHGDMLFLLKLTLAPLLVAAATLATRLVLEFLPALGEPPSSDCAACAARGNPRAAGAELGELHSTVCHFPTRASGPCLEQSNSPSAEMVHSLETIYRCRKAFHSRLELECKKLRVVARLVQIAAMEPERVLLCRLPHVPLLALPWARVFGRIRAEPPDFAYLVSASLEIRSAAQPFIEPYPVA
jgi:hypothetical protein